MGQVPSSGLIDATLASHSLSGTALKTVNQDRQDDIVCCCIIYDPQTPLPETASI